MQGGHHEGDRGIVREVAKWTIGKDNGQEWEWVSGMDSSGTFSALRYFNAARYLLRDNSLEPESFKKRKKNNVQVLHG